MILISHRGNTSAKRKELENSPTYVKQALHLGYDVEIDVWYDNGWWLGHDEPQYKVDMNFLEDRRFWIHCKNLQALTQI